MGLSSPKIKKFLIFQEMEISSPKNFSSSEIKKKYTLKKFVIFRELELSTHKLKKLFYFFYFIFYISRETSKTLKAKNFYSSPKKFINKFLSKHFRIIVFIFPIN